MSDARFLGLAMYENHTLLKGDVREKKSNRTMSRKTQKMRQWLVEQEVELNLLVDDPR